ncbi:alternate-type signal peptide domain-containing protein [Galactobacter valiniphilus]|uniref:alternate-type signal peptide domain-containing protein n=1 Tax=Galactobacter valiniphilus TaxID=2676122 RepID=UPI003735E363
MKQNTRVVVAGALVLGLAAGGGTFALWSSSAQVDGGGINTGELNVKAVEGSLSYDDLNTPAVNDWNNATDKMVPSDRVGAKQSFTLTLVGKNLKAKVNLVAGTANPAVADLATGVEGTITKVGGTPVALTDDFEVDASWNGATVVVTSTFDFDEDAQGSMNSGTQVTGGGITLEQYTTP